MQILAFNSRHQGHLLNCPCCLGAPDTLIELSHTTEDAVYDSRGTGKTIYRQTRVFKHPYCRQCLGHIEDVRNYAALGWEPTAIHWSWPVGMLTGMIWISIVLFFALDAEDEGFGIKQLGVIFGSFVFLAVFFWWAHLKFQANDGRNREQHKEQQERLRQKVQTSTKSLCASPDRLAVRYQGWKELTNADGSVEEWNVFEYMNEDFAEAMRVLAGENCKVLRKKQASPQKADPS